LSKPVIFVETKAQIYVCLQKFELIAKAQLKKQSKIFVAEQRKDQARKVCMHCIKFENAIQFVICEAASWFSGEGARGCRTSRKKFRRS